MRMALLRHSPAAANESGGLYHCWSRSERPGKRRRLNMYLLQPRCGALEYVAGAPYSRDVIHAPPKFLVYPSDLTFSQMGCILITKNHTCYEECCK